MKVEFIASSNPSNDTVMAYEYGDQTPLCSIYETDLAELLTPAQWAMWESGNRIFNVTLTRLRENCRRWFAVGRN